MQITKNHRSHGIAVPPWIGVGSEMEVVIGKRNPVGRVESELALEVIVPVKVDSGENVNVEPSERVNIVVEEISEGMVTVSEPAEITV